MTDWMGRVWAHILRIKEVESPPVHESPRIPKASTTEQGEVVYVEKHE